jgi:4-hydroxy-3-polyprenylbenzoate decarboxylase
MDVLDHSCSKLGFGGKMCIDGTKKMEEEITAPLIPFKLSEQFSAVLARSKYPEITGINDKLAGEWGIAILFVAVKKERINHVTELHDQLCAMPGMDGIRMILYVEHTVRIDNIADVLWRFCNNLDPRRDHFYGGKEKNILGLDGTRKSKKMDNFERPWPNIIAADDKTIAAVDKKWDQLGLGKIIFSPSLQYRTQLYRGGASVLDSE